MRGTWSLVTRGQVICELGNTFIHQGHDAFHSLLFLGGGTHLGQHCHLLSIFLHEVMGHLSHCFGNVKAVVPLRMAGGQCPPGHTSQSALLASGGCTPRLSYATHSFETGMWYSRHSISKAPVRAWARASGGSYGCWTGRRLQPSHTGHGPLFG